MHEGVSQGTTIASFELAVISPCFNEQDNIATLVKRTMAVFDTMGVAGQLVLVDDGSADNTWKNIQQAQSDEPRVLGLQHKENRGIVEGWRTGLGSSKSELVCLIDSDLQNPPEDIARFFRAYNSQSVDVVQGVRISQEEMSRYIIRKALNKLLNAVYATKLRDNKSGFLLCRREVMQAILQHRYHYRYFQHFVGVSACVQGFSIAEVETEFQARFSGQSFLGRFPVRVPLRVCWEIVKFRLEIQKRRNCRKGSQAL